MKRTWSKTQEYGQLGIIESVHLRNFMCHDNLSFDFDPHLNFIIGRNGSGKSAVLTAIILALGGKSATTGRYSNLKGFIKTGKNSSTISVTLKNCGPDAYDPHRFGKRIIVERHFSVDGSNNYYTLKAEDGRAVTRSKDELVNILNIMDIQIDNPITVLTQETSRNFLLSKKPEKLFHLFYKGTGLAKVHDDYNRSAQQKKEAKQELLNKKAVLPEMEKDVKKLKSLLDKSSKVTELKKELLWAQVIEFERKRDESQRDFENIKKDVVELEKRLNTLEDELAAMGQTLTSAQADKKAASDQIEAIRADFTEEERKRAALATALREIKGKHSSHDREVKRVASEISSLERIIEDIRLKNENDINDTRLRHEETVNNLKNQIMIASNQIKALQDQSTSLRESHATVMNKIDTCQAELNEISYEKQRIVREKEALIEGKKDRVRVFGREMANVLSDIKFAVQARKFKVEPKGPIGLYITVKQHDWNFAVEECLKKNLLRTFVCDNHADAEVLTAILNKHFQRNRPSIITSKFVSEVYDVRPHKTVCEHPTVLDMLTIKDPVITNCLIDQMAIENILLIADPTQALNLMLYKPPNKCRYAYTKNGDQYCHSPFRNYSCRNNSSQFCLLRSVNEDDIRKKEVELVQLDQAYAEKQLDKDNLRQQQSMKEREIRDKDNEITQFKMKINQLHRRLQEEENNYEAPKDINCLHNDLVQLQKQKEQHEECLAACTQEVQFKTAELRTLVNKIDELKQSLNEESQKFHMLSNKLEEHQNKKEKIEALIVKCKTRLKDLQPKYEECKKELANDIATVEMATKSALDVGPRIDTRRSSDTIRQILKETETFIQKQKNCDRDTLLKEYEDKIETLNKAKQELERQEKINKRLDSMLAQRFLEFQKICKNTSVCLTCCFTGYLRDNNFSGYPDINFEKHTLDICVQPEKMKSKVTSKNHNLSQLSGGERSYVTIALLLSLWDRIHMPFRILDEYDVFMDSNNRHLSILQLIKAARANTRVQFIFLSPLELPVIEDGDHIKIHKMPAPRK